MATAKVIDLAQYRAKKLAAKNDFVVTDKNGDVLREFEKQSDAAQYFTWVEPKAWSVLQKLTLPNGAVVWLDVSIECLSMTS